MESTGSSGGSRAARGPEVGAFSLGLRAQIALALLAVLVLAAAIANAAIRPLTAASSRAVRRRAGITLVRAVAGQVSLMRDDRAALQPLVTDAVGEGALSAAAVVDERGAVVASAGRFYRSIPTGALWVESQEETASAMRMVVVLPRGGALVGEVSLTQSPGERTLVAAMLLYTLLASSAGLFVLYALLTRYTVRPLEALTRVAERVAAGSREARAEPRGAREIARAATAFNGMTEELAQRESELRKRVAELERAQGELRAAQARLVRSERLAVVGRLSAGIAHEVGNPLAAIVGLADLLAEGGLDESEVQDFSRRIGQEAQRIHRTVRDLLDYARARPGAEGDEVGAREEVADGRGDVGDAVEQVRRLLEPQRTMKELKMTVELGPELPTVKLSNDRLVQVLLNLCLNAADAIRDARGDGAVGAITLRASRHGGGVAIEVEDDGPGIEPAIRERVFEPFFTTKPAGQGTGLGLAICASVVEQAGGAVSALARQDGAPGARVRVELPAA